jgi:hypothetical protein
MISAMILSAALWAHSADDPNNYTGRMIDLLNEGSTWGMPTSGLPITIVIDGGGKVGPTEFKLKGPKWASEAPLKLGGLAFADGALTGTVAFENKSGLALSGVRFDIISATERYKGKNDKGEEVELTRTQNVAEESPILFGDMLKGAGDGPFPIKAAGLAWNPETVSISVSGKLSGLAFRRILFDDHFGSTLAIDRKGRLLIGSGRQPGIYRADPDKGSVDLIASTPEPCVVIGSNPSDGSIGATWLNSHVFQTYTEGGDAKETFEEGDVDGMRSWPSMMRFDGKGTMYAGFGSTVAQFNGSRPSFILDKMGAFEFGGSPRWDVAADGTLYIGMEDGRLFKFDPGGKNGRLLVQGPSSNLGRLFQVGALRVDPNNQVWVFEPNFGDFHQRASVYDANGKLVWVFGRGGPTWSDVELYDAQLPASTMSFAVAGDGRVFISTNEYTRAVMEFAIF